MNAFVNSSWTTLGWQPLGSFALIRCTSFDERMRLFNKNFHTSANVFIVCKLLLSLQIDMDFLEPEVGSFVEVSTIEDDSHTVPELTDEDNENDSFMLVPSKDCPLPLTSTPKKKQPFSCDQCGKSYSTKYNLTRHLDSHNSSRKLYKVCGRHFDTLSDLQAHQDVSHQPQLREICGKKFKKRCHVVEHKEAVHGGGGDKFVCNIEGCQQSFTRKTKLQMHMNHHIGATPFQCQNCSKSFEDKYQCYRHELSCASHISFKCTRKGCDMVFATKDDLWQHKVALHKGSVFICPCGKRYTYRSGLYRHQKTCLA